MRDGFVASITVVFVVLVGAVAAHFAIQDDREWQAYAAAHCKVAERVSASTSTGHGYGMMSNGSFGHGMVTTRTPGKTAYDCDDGVRYWR